MNEFEIKQETRRVVGLISECLEMNGVEPEVGLSALSAIMCGCFPDYDNLCEFLEMLKKQAKEIYEQQML